MSEELKALEARIAALEKHRGSRKGETGGQGPAGADSTVPGPAGPAGQSIVGPQGPAGKDSTVAGPAGRDGINGTNGTNGKDSTVPGPQGPAGKDAKQIVIGEVTSGDDPAAELVETDDAVVLNLVLPTGKNGRDGVNGQSITGPQGPAGQSITGATGATGPEGPAADISHISAQLRYQWKNDIAVALRGHFAESHQS